MPKDFTPWKESFGIVPNYFYDPNQIKRVTTEHRQRFYVFPLKNYQVMEGSKTQVLPSASRPTCIATLIVVLVLGIITSLLDISPHIQ